jgi:carbon storage regulator CsrA
MLVLSRRIDQRITIRLEDGREIGVMLVDAGGGRARLGFAAPAGVIILRDELTAPGRAGPARGNPPAAASGGRRS